MRQPLALRAVVAALLLSGGVAVPLADPAWAGAGPERAAHRPDGRPHRSGPAQRTAPVRYAPGEQPPELPVPQPGTGCVGESPTVAGTAPWALSRLAPPHVWPLTRGDGILVAVVDTGVSPDPPGLAGAVRPGTDVVRRDRADRDCFGRGTALAGIVAARPVTGSGVVGLAPGAAILPIRIVDGRGEVPPGALARGIRAATAARADVILLGVGTAAPDAELRDAVRAAIAADIVLVASVSDAKPSGTGQRVPPWYPAADPDVLAVGGVDEEGRPTETSPAEAGVDLLAPGAGAVSVGPRGDGHYSVGGPAVAAAYVAGAAALVRAYHPELSQAEVRRRLELTAEHPLGGGPLPGVGYGTLDLYSAVTVLDPREQPLPSDPPRLAALPRPASADPAKFIAGSVAAGTVIAAGLAYLAVLTVRWGRRRRWRP